MTTRVKILVFDHDDTSVESLAEFKEHRLNEAIEQLELEGNKILSISETIVNSGYSIPDPDHGYRDSYFKSNGTLVAILYQRLSLPST